MNNNIVVSIVIPCRNEEKHIGECLDSITNSNFPKKNLEVLVVDGMSRDRTRILLKKYVESYPFINVLDNKKKITPAAINIGISKASGNYIMILSSHSKIDKNFIKANIDTFEKNNADCVGGILITIPPNDTLLAQAIAISLSHPFGIGNSYFRIGLKEPRYVDTVPFGCYKREVFSNNGLFDEELIRNQDDEFNFRLIKNGGKILLNPNIVSYYYTRDSLSKLWKMYFQYGIFKPLVAKKVGAVMTWRQIIPPLFVSSLTISLTFALLLSKFIWLFMLILISYISVNTFFSFWLSLKKGFKYLLVLPITFATLHLSYGLGYLKGILDYFIFKKSNTDIPLTR